jgi:hypothetical protein
MSHAGGQSRQDLLSSLLSCSICLAGYLFPSGALHGIDTLRLSAELGLKAINLPQDAPALGKLYQRNASAKVDRSNRDKSH